MKQAIVYLILFFIFSCSAVWLTAYFYVKKQYKIWYNAGANRAFNEMKKYASKIQYRCLQQLYRERANDILK